MVPELGNFALIVALCCAVIQCFHLISKETFAAAVTGQFIFLAFAMGCLIFSFIENDMSVIFVRQHSHELLPLMYRIGAAWGGHEGSLLLWCLILSFWTFIFKMFVDPTLSKKTLGLIITVLGWISVGFLLFLICTSNPFSQDVSAPMMGNDLTPVLQDPGLIFHPPILYLGYVGFAVGFAFAVAALVEGKLFSDWTRAYRPWIIIPWSLLGCGIVLGSWWAYRELGWGGWWFWDPVENASLLPWLSATALLHSLMISEKHHIFIGWTILLSIITFALSLLGTFLVRSGVLISVHAFASDPTRGLFLLAFLTFVIGGALLLYALKVKYFYRIPNIHFFSHETLLLINSVILISVTATILLGTLYPIALEMLNLSKISIGEPYYNTVFLPFGLLILLLMGLASHTHWNKILIKKMIGILFCCLLLALFFPHVFNFPFRWVAVLGITLSLWVFSSTIMMLIRRPFSKTWLSTSSMAIAHIGIAVLALGITINKSYSEERQVKMNEGETVELAGYSFKFDKLAEWMGPNFKSFSAIFYIEKNHQFIDQVTAEQRIYLSHEQTLAKPGILANPWHDLYIALGLPLPNDAWVVRIYYKPFVRFIWLGGLLLLLSGFFSVLNYFLKRCYYAKT